VGLLACGQYKCNTAVVLQCTACKASLAHLTHAVLVVLDDRVNVLEVCLQPRLALQGHTSTHVNEMTAQGRTAGTALVCHSTATTGSECTTAVYAAGT
jgi:hypothetical protein